MDTTHRVRAAECFMRPRKNGRGRHIAGVIGSTLIILLSVFRLSDQAFSQSLLRPTVTAATVNFWGLMYGPFRDGQNPNLGKFPSLDQITEDVRILASIGLADGKRWLDVIGLYSTDHGFANVISLAAPLGVRVMPGCFLDNSSNDNQEVNSLINNLISYGSLGNIPFAMVGSEAFSQHHVQIDQLIARIKQVQTATSHQVQIGTAESWKTWLDYPQLADAVDVIMVNVYPYHEGYAIDGAPDYAITQFRKVQAAYPHQPAVIGETGWPSKGESYGAADAGVENEEVYASQIYFLATTLGISVLYFEAFDEAWKESATGTVNQAHFGIFTSQRNIAFGIAKGPFGAQR